MLSVWQKFVVLSPFFGIHFLVLCFIMYAGWFLVTRKHKNFSFDWFTPAVLAFLICAIEGSGTLIQDFQGQALQTAQRASVDRNVASEPALAPADPSQTSAPERNPQSQPPAEQPKVDPILKSRGEFLAQVDVLLNNPDKYTDEVKKQLFQHYAALFPSVDEKKAYNQYIAVLFQCEIA
jgi:hypothetical protein